MVKHRAAFDEWLEYLPDLSFTDFGGCHGAAEEECLPAVLLKSVTMRLDQLDPEERRLADALIRRLNEIEIRIID